MSRERVTLAQPRGEPSGAMTPTHFRSLLPWIAALFVAGCDSGFDPLPPVDAEARFSIDLQIPDRSLEGVVQAVATCQVFLGGVRAEPERVTLKADGTTIATRGGSTVEGPVTLSSLGAHAVTAECTLGADVGSVERTIEVVEPVWVTVHLRNFTQDGEPFVRGEGPITFTVGDVQVISQDSAVVPVLPGHSYEVFADHPSFLQFWARIQDHLTGETLEFYHVRDQNSPVWVASSTSVDVLKLRETDITEGLPRYTIDQLRTVFFGNYTPYTGMLSRFVADSIGVHISTEDLAQAPAVQRAIDKLFSGGGPYHVSKLTRGVVRAARVSSEPFPRDSPVIYVDLYRGAYPSVWHSEWTDGEGVIEQSSMTLTPGPSDRTTTAYFLHALGLSGGVGGDQINPFVDFDANPSPFALLALKILYGSPPGTRF